VRAAAPLLAPLFAGVIRRADEIDLALRARAFRLDAPRSAFRPARPGAADYAAVAAALCLFLAGVYAQF
jgi:energy-coupling factor transporter transmembrane protein EcfT